MHSRSAQATLPLHPRSQQRAAFVRRPAGNSPLRLRGEKRVAPTYDRAGPASRVGRRPQPDTPGALQAQAFAALRSPGARCYYDKQRPRLGYNPSLASSATGSSEPCTAASNPHPLRGINALEVHEVKLQADQLLIERCRIWENQNPLK